MQHSARGRERAVRQANRDLFVPTEAAVTGEGRANAHKPTGFNGIRWEVACYQGSQEDQGIIHGAVGFGVRCRREGLQSPGKYWKPSPLLLSTRRCDPIEKQAPQKAILTHLLPT